MQGARRADAALCGPAQYSRDFDRYYAQSKAYQQERATLAQQLADIKHTWRSDGGQSVRAAPAAALMLHTRAVIRWIECLAPRADGRIRHFRSHTY